MRAPAGKSAKAAVLLADLARRRLYRGAVLVWMHDGDEAREVERLARNFAVYSNLRIINTATHST